MQVQKAIEQLGFSAKEAKTYLAALRLGESLITDIAARVQLPRSTTQVVAERLRGFGLMDYYVSHGRKHWMATSPERLLDLLREREAALREALPQLSALQQASWGNKRSKRRDDGLGALRAVGDASAQPMLVTNDVPEIVYVNRAWERQFGYRFDEVRGKNPRVLQSGQTPKDVHARMWQALAAGKLFQSDDIVDKRKDGTTFSMVTTIFPSRQNGRTYYVQLLNEAKDYGKAEALRLQQQ